MIDLLQFADILKFPMFFDTAVLSGLRELNQHEHIMHWWQYKLSWKLTIQEVIPESGNEMFSAWSAARNSWILLSSWASADFIRAVDVTLPDRSYLFATLRYFGRLGKNDGTAWEFNRCVFISSVLLLLSPLPWTKSCVAKMNRTDSWVGCGLEAFTWGHFSLFTFSIY